jgi:hypothetical protein
VQDWQKWLNSPKRAAFNDQVEQLSLEEAGYVIYEPLVSGIIAVPTGPSEK